MARFEDQDLTDAEFRECDLTRARLIGVVMQDAVIDGLVSNLVVNGVEVTSYVEAELDRRHPVRLLIRSADPADLQEAARQLRAGWAATLGRLHEMPGGSEHRRVGGEWSAAETLRHLVFVHDSWFRRCCTGSAKPFTAIGLACEFVPDQEEQGLDRAAAPSLDEVLELRDVQGAELERWLSAVTPDELSAPAPVPAGRGWPPYARGKSVLECVHVVLNEEWAHHGFCVRDLDLLGSASAGAVPKQEPAAGHQAPGSLPAQAAPAARLAQRAMFPRPWQPAAPNRSPAVTIMTHAVRPNLRAAADEQRTTAGRPESGGSGAWLLSWWLAPCECVSGRVSACFKNWMPACTGRRDWRGRMADAGDAAAEAAANRDLWTQANREYGDEHADRAWAAGDITWGIFNVPEEQIGVLGDVRGLDVIELGCGTAYFSAWLAKREARPTGVDITPAQLATARRCQQRSGISFPLIEADAGDVPLPPGSFDLAVSECGASLWCDPGRWVPEAARLLRPGGRLVFHTVSVLAAVCCPEPPGPARRELLRPQREARRLATAEGGVEFHPSHGEWITTLRASGFAVDYLREIYAPPDATDHPYYQLATADWARQWPIEEIWVAHLAQ